MADDGCEPRYEGICDCACPGDPAAGGCPDCPARCFTFSGCGTTTERGLYCPSAWRPGVHYVARSPIECAAVDFGCAEGETLFSNACGCGCVGGETDPVCPDPSGEGVQYHGLSERDCAAIDFACSRAEEHFETECGCGCIAGEPPPPPPPGECAALPERECAAEPLCQASYGGFCDCDCDDRRGYEGGGCDRCPARCFFFDGCRAASEPPRCPSPYRGARYISTDPSACAAALFRCEDGELLFSNECGCGCIE